MIFEFLKYIRPVHYFNLKNRKSCFVYPVVKNKDVDYGFNSSYANEYYHSYIKVMNGYISKGPYYKSFEKLSILDNYIFLRKTQNKFWVFYVLLIRLFSFKNPLVELRSFWNTKNLNTENCKPFLYKDYENFDGNLIDSQPLVSVVIPTLNRYKYLKDVLSDLENQNYQNFEVLIVDQSSPFNEEFYDNCSLNLKIIKQPERALWKARNTAVKKSKGDYILLFDDDSRVEPNWVSEHLKCIEYFNADVSSGVSISLVGDKVPENYSFFRISDQLDTGNVMMKKEVFKKVGLFDRQFEGQRQGDGEFGLRIFLNDLLNISNPFAQRLHLKVKDGGLREMGSWDGLRPKNIFSPRPIPSILYSSRKYYGGLSSILMLIKSIPFSLTPYKYKGEKVAKSMSVFILVLFFPIIFVQVSRSWIKSSQMLKEGSRIEKL